MHEATIETWGAPSIAEDWDTHPGATFFVLGTGTSLRGFDYARLRDRHVIALNDAIKFLPAATYHLYSDGMLYGRYFQVPYGEHTKIVVQHETVRKLQPSQEWEHIPKVRIFTRPPETSIFNVRHDTDELWVTRTVSTAGIMLAWKLGAALVYLLGCDCYRQPDGTCYSDGTPHKEKYAVVATTPEGMVIEDRHRAWIQGHEVLKGYLNYQRDQLKRNVPEVIN